MDKLRFGTAGVPLSTPERNTLNGIAHVRKLGLDAMELEFVRSVNITPEKAPLVKDMAKKNDVVLTCHGQYYINLNAQEAATLKASVKRVLEAAERANECGAWSLCFHMAYNMGLPPEKVYENVKKQAKSIVKELKDSGNKIWLRPETGGKLSQFAGEDYLMKLSEEVEQVLPCIDWAHQYARSNGKVNDRKGFSAILEKIESRLGKEALQNMHMHVEGIEYSEKGEKNHVNLDECEFDYKTLMKVWKDFKIRGVAISESPNIESDALNARKAYEKA